MQWCSSVAGQTDTTILLLAGRRGPSVDEITAGRLCSVVLKDTALAGAYLRL